MMSNEPEASRRSREMLAKLLLSPSQDQTTPEGLFQVANHYAQRDGWRFDWSAGVEYWWDLARVGAVALLGGGGGSSYAQAPQFVLTAHGRRLLQGGDSSPHDETRYISALRRRVASPDAVALSYLKEGIAERDIHAAAREEKCGRRSGGTAPDDRHGDDGGHHARSISTHLVPTNFATKPCLNQFDFISA